MSGDKQSQKKLSMAHRRVAVARLYLEQNSQMDIAAQVGVTQQTISNDLKAIRDDWMARAAYDLSQAKARELARIDQLEAHYWREWYRSQAEGKSSTQERINGSDSTREKLSLHKTDRLGDPRYLAGIQWCIERRCAILGLNAASKQELSGPDGKPIAFTDTPAFADLSDDELDKLIAESESRKVSPDSTG